MIIWGSRGDVVNLGFVEAKTCETCEKERPFNLILAYGYAHVYYVFGSVTEKKYWLSCEVCGRGSELDIRNVESQLEKVPIPWERRFGCLLGIALLVAILLLGQLL